LVLGLVNFILKYKLWHLVYPPHATYPPFSLLVIKTLGALLYETPGIVHNVLLNILDHYTALTFCIFIKFVRLHPVNLRLHLVHVYNL
jgi:hypothetical protein